jgi:competence protein ComEA
MTRVFAVTLLLAGVLSWSAAHAAEKGKPAQPVNLNTATVDELAKLPGIGKTIAQRIVRHREKSGPFRTVEELLVVRGISRKKFEQLRPYITIEAEEAKETEEKD